MVEASAGDGRRRDTEHANEMQLTVGERKIKKNTSRRGDFVLCFVFKYVKRDPNAPSTAPVFYLLLATKEQPKWLTGLLPPGC